MKIYESPYLQLYFEATYQLIEFRWQLAHINMDENDFKQELLNYLAAVEELKPQKLLSDTANFAFTIPINLQEWANQTIFPSLLAAGLETVAFVVSQEIIAQMSIEQTMEEPEGLKFTTRYFDDYEKAKQWLISY
jgi:hypothetical protein